MAFYRCGTGGGAEKLLWTNPNPTSTMSATTITLSSSLTSFTWMKVNYAWKNNDQSGTAKTGDVIFSVVALTSSTANGKLNARLTAYHDTNNVSYSRFITYNSATSLQIRGATAVNQNTGVYTDGLNAFCIPLKIYGVN